MLESSPFQSPVTPLGHQPPLEPAPVPHSSLSHTFLHLANTLADHIALQCFLLASTNSPGLAPTRGFLLTGPPGTGKSSVLHHVAQRLAHSHDARIVPISAVAGVKFYVKDDNLLKSFVRKHALDDDAVLGEEPPTPILLVLDDLADVASYESIESARTLFLADLARVLTTLRPNLPIAVLASVTDSSANLKPALFTYTQALPDISEPIRCEIMHTILSPLKDSLTFNAADLPTHSPNGHGPLAAFAAHIAALTPGYTPRDLTLVARQLIFLATSRTSPHPSPATPDTLAAHLASTLALAPTLCASHVPAALARVRASLSVSHQFTRPVPRVAWSDVQGYGEGVAELKAAVVWPLRDPLAYVRVGARAPRGVLLYGPPGCGKTMLVHALASEPGVNVVSVKGPELLSKYFGESESRLRALFAQARKSTPCLLFFDEMDVLGVKRAFSTSSSSASSVNERVLSTLLNEMDGVSTSDGVVVVGCTSRPWDMDDALLRPGRLDRLVYVGLPTEQDRAAVLRGVGTRWAEGVDLDKVAKRAVGVSGGQLKVLVREAGIKAMVKDGPGVERVAWDEVVEAASEMGVPLESEDDEEHVMEEEDGWEDLDDAVSVSQQLRALAKRAEEVEAPYVQFRNMRSAK